MFVNDSQVLQSANIALPSVQSSSSAAIRAAVPAAAVCLVGFISLVKRGAPELFFVVMCEYHCSENYSTEDGPRIH